MVDVVIVFLMTCFHVTDDAFKENDNDTELLRRRTHSLAAKVGIT